MTPAALAACDACSNRIDADDQFCEACGTALRHTQPAHTRDRSTTSSKMAAAVTDRGLVHTTNEDAYFLDLDGDTSTLVVCDGVSSSTAGGLAARVAADAAGAALRATMTGPERAVVDAIVAARDAVAEIAWAPMRDTAAPSTTIVVATVADRTVTVASVGDSRAYWIDDVEVRQLTRDDSWAEEQVASGHLRADEALLDPRAHMITAWLGADAPELSPTVVSFRPARRGHLLLCSDGLWNYWPQANDLAALLREIDAAQTVDLVHALTDRAVAAGGRDNITVVLAELDPGRRP